MKMESNTRRRNEAGFTMIETLVAVGVVCVLIAIGVELRSNWTIQGDFVNPVPAFSAGQQTGFVFQELRTRTWGKDEPAAGRPITFTVVQPTTASPNSLWIVSYVDQNGTFPQSNPVATINAITDARGMVVVYLNSDAIGPGYGLTATDTSPKCIKCTETANFKVTK
jgi:prepilin-type N-terminal cleavage/methylation domain-containing protein